MGSDDDRRPVGPGPLLALGVNGIVGVGIFFAPADIAARAPGAGTTIFAATAIVLIPVALAFATLGRRFDRGRRARDLRARPFGSRPAFVVG